LSHDLMDLAAKKGECPLLVLNVLWKSCTPIQLEERFTDLSGYHTSAYCSFLPFKLLQD